MTMSVSLTKTPRSPMTMDHMIGELRMMLNGPVRHRDDWANLGTVGLRQAGLRHRGVVVRGRLLEGQSALVRG